MELKDRLPVLNPEIKQKVKRKIKKTEDKSKIWDLIMPHLT